MKNQKELEELERFLNDQLFELKIELYPPEFSSWPYIKFSGILKIKNSDYKFGLTLARIYIDQNNGVEFFYNNEDQLLEFDDVIQTLKKIISAEGCEGYIKNAMFNYPNWTTKQGRMEEYRVDIIFKACENHTLRRVF